jgi:two-component system, sensor histidine kinase
MAQVRHEQIASMFRNGLVTIPITTLAAAVLVGLFFSLGVLDPVVGWTWLGLLAFQSAVRVGLLLAWRRAKPTPEASRRWADWFTAGVLVGGVLWGFGALFLTPSERFDLQLLVLLMITAIVYASIASFGGWLPAFYAFLFPALVPSIVWGFLQGNAEHVTYALLATIWVPAMAMLGFRYNRSLERSIALGYENASLAEDARRQKTAAEEANAAKSRFLASASHDLRQPVHALGLFAGALRHENLPAKAGELASRIDGAVEALDKLFIALLDVSRLDAGVVVPEPRAVDVGAMLLRLKSEMTSAAGAKGLDLSVHARSAWVRSDPILLERIVRNLMSNAVSYTARGGILVAVRTAGRAQAAIEVWDTGPGIAENQRERVFEEFYRPKETGSQPQGGLGLGLSIVRRLCVLLDHGLELQSKPGRGSMFRVHAPLADAPVESDAPPVLGFPAVGTRIWVIDDDSSVRAAMEALLGSWGHIVTAGASSDEMLAHIDRDSRPPHVILCDWRLGAEDGIGALRRLQAKFASPVPAALITGDTDPQRLREAAASGLPLLHKPVARASLRALIGNLARESEARS